jgi:GDP-D-mannose 3',5'-epimerase
MVTDSSIESVLDQRILVTGAGGFIGHHLVTRLKQEGAWVRGVDLKLPSFGESYADEFEILDLRNIEAAIKATKGIDHVYALAADMGGMGYISFHQSEILQNNLLINLNTVEAVKRNKCTKIFFASSACVYPEYLQEETSVIPLKEGDAYPALPQDLYGWEKLTAERLYLGNCKEGCFQSCVARFHNIYGPMGAWRGGREKAPAAICRKIAEAKRDRDEAITIWGDGTQTRSFCYIDDCIEGIVRLMASGYNDPVNIGHDQCISINELVTLISTIARYEVRCEYDLQGPQGVRGRNSDNTLLTTITGWKPTTTPQQGLESTYHWIAKQLQ